jgi:alpha-glucosidase
MASRLAASGSEREAAVLLAALMCLRGTIFLYQGEELGLPQARVPFERLRDPFAIAAYQGEAGRDGARTPMPWTEAGPSAGFSASAGTWLPVDPVHLRLAVDAQEANPQSMLALTRSLIALRRRSAALRVGDARVRSAPAGVLAIERTVEDERLLCLLDLGGRGAIVAVDSHARQRLGVNGGAMVSAGQANLGPFCGAILDISLSAPPDRQFSGRI